ncbi:hypothetical protein CANARDRAFT_29191 [[Candida] arabinofermentans NRRL YB-2248]|uniref:Uncharacterized protein n=1 Tax=[Candida] arabinofermentans NRRL YB-2248 TaxID=983967 RepID=A0A1E4SXT8_9ASCO|nr:hypothetical protein CANARDRAFT_29191 [[Candida] arabinofermentans NRRL YB-2248]
MVESTMQDGKRRKLELQSGKNGQVIKHSKIFSPFRVLGHVSNGTPFAIGTLGSSFYIATAVGRSFQIYDASTLHLLFVSNTQTPKPITSITAHFQYIYCSYGDKVGIFRRGRLEYELSLPTTAVNETIDKVIVFGTYLVAATSSSLYIYEKKDLKYATEYYTTIKINSLYGEIIDLIHMPAYINKIVVATNSNLLVFNIKSTKLLFTSEEFVNGITCIESAPALDIIAIGNGEGTCIVYNIKKARTLRTINTGSNSKITSVSFRTDGSPHLVCSMVNGDLFFYDLNKKSRVHILRNAHKEVYGGVTKASFLNGQPIVVTTGPDNSLKEYVFDPVLSTTNSSVVSPPRHLRSRGGHSAPPTAITFSDSKSHFIQSASQDRSFWTFSLRKDAQSQEMSQKQSKIDKNGNRLAGKSSGFKDKFPAITNIAQENSREGEWDNIVTSHQEETFARTWDSRNKKLGKYQLSTIDNGIVKSVSITQCGNFALIGSSLGGIGVYNLQSGKLRKNYKLHKKTVTGIAVDGMNRKMVSCGLDGIVGFYDFSKSQFLGKLKLDAPITQLVYHRSSDLVALALDDLSIVIVDSVTQKVVRQLFGHTNRITSLDFSPDGRWIISSSLDSTIRTWDLPTGGCIDGIKVASVVTCLKFSPLGDYLATTHVNGVGISLWTNKSQFKPVSTRHVEEEEFANVTLPNVSGDGGSSMLDGAFTVDDDDDDVVTSGNYQSVDQIDEQLLTLSLCSKNKFNTLLHLDTIKLRNKPKEAPKKPESLPFFLELTGKSVGDDAKENELGKININKTESTNDSKLFRLDESKNYSFESEFTTLLRTCASTNDFDKFISFLVNSSPSNIDLEIRSLTTESPYTELISFINAISFGLKQNKNFEMLVVFIHTLFSVHGDVIYTARKQQIESNDKDANNLINALSQWGELNGQKNGKLDSLIKYCSGVINFITTV